MKKKLQLSEWIDGKLSKEEERNIPDLELYQKIKDYSADLQAPTLNKTKVKRHVDLNKKEKSISSMYLKIAATLVVLLGIGSALFYIGQQSIVGQNSMNSIDLPDDSKALLQNNSSLNYNQYFWFLNREVKLDGKAFFEVEKGKKFTVNTSHGKVEVLGTKFSVESDSAHFKVMCFEGEVAVYFNKQKEVLQPNKSVEIDVVNKKINLIDFNYNQPIWVADEVKFNAIAFDDLMRLISNKFSIEIDHSALQNPSTFTGNLQLNNLKETLAVLSSTYSIQIKQTNKNNYIFVEDEME